MSTDWLIAVHCCYEPGQKPPAGAVLDWLFEYGCSSGPDGGTDQCQYFGKESATASDYAPTEAARAELTAGHGRITLQLDDLEFQYQNWEGMLEGMPELPYHTFRVPERNFAPAPSEDAASTRVTAFVDMISTFADETGVFYAFGGRGAGESQSTKQDASRLLSGTVERLFWFNYMSETIVEEFGRERLLSTPATRVEERADGAVLLVLSSNPHRRVAGDKPVDMRAERHLGL